MWKPEHYLDRSILWVPKRLREACLNGGMNVRRMDAALLAYDLVEHRAIRHDNAWVEIPDGRFRDRIPSNKTRTTAKSWLESMNFIQIKKRLGKKGQVLNDKIPGRRSQRYRACLLEEERQLHSLRQKSNVAAPSPEADALCRHTRAVLNRMTADANDLTVFLEKTEPALLPEKRLACRYAVQTLCNHIGTVGRGLRVNRLYSPWTNCPKIIRHIFRIDHEPLAEIDLQASQPTLLGLLAADEDFVQACRKDEVYRSIEDRLNVCRDQAKESFFRYLYGPIRTARSREENRRICIPIQEWVEDCFPKLHKKVVQGKMIDHRVLNRELQNKEAEIFLDGVLADLIAEGVHALTIHDAVYVPISSADKAVRIVRDYLQPILAGKAILRVEREGNTTQIAI